MSHPKVVEAAVIGVPHERWVERPLACVVVEPGETLDRRGTARAPRAARRALVAARRRGVHRRGAQDQRRQVLQAHPAGEVRGLRIPRRPLNRAADAARRFSPRPPRRSCRRRAASRPTRWSARRPSAGHGHGAPSGRSGRAGAPGRGRASRTATHRAPRLTPTERVLSDRAWSTAFATSSVITIAASWARSSPMPHSCVAARRNSAPDRAPWRRRAGPAREA